MNKSCIKQPSTKKEEIINIYKIFILNKQLQISAICNSKEINQNRKKKDHKIIKIIFTQFRKKLRIKLKKKIN